MTHRTSVPTVTPPARGHHDAIRTRPERSRRVVVAGLGAATLVLLVATAPARAIEDRARMFAMLDTDADGRLSPVEVRMTPLASRFALLDLNADGALEPHEIAIRKDGVIAPADRTP